MLFFSLSKKSDRLHTPWNLNLGISDRVVSGGKTCKMCNNNAESSLIPLPFSRKETVKNVVIHFLLHYDVQLVSPSGSRLMPHNTFKIKTNLTETIAVVGFGEATVRKKRFSC